jgi:hypothetical protein
MNYKQAMNINRWSSIRARVLLVESNDVMTTVEQWFPIDELEQSSPILLVIILFMCLKSISNILVINGIK